MTIEEAIQHCDDVANNCDNEQCSLDHSQLKQWLVELVERRNQPTKKEMIEKAKEAFCKSEKCGVPINTCMSLGTCLHYDEFVKLLEE